MSYLGEYSYTYTLFFHDAKSKRQFLKEYSLLDSNSVREYNSTNTAMVIVSWDIIDTNFWVDKAGHLIYKMEVGDKLMYQPKLID